MTRQILNFVLATVLASIAGIAVDRAVAASTAVPPPCPAAAQLKQIVVDKAYKHGASPQDTQVQLRDEIVLEGQHFPTLLQKAQCSVPTKKVVLFLDGRPVKDVTAFPPTDPDKSLFVFPLKRTESSRETWTHVLGRPQWEPRQTSVSVGLDDEFPVDSTATVLLEVIPHGWFVAWAIIFLALLVFFIAVAKQSDVIRDWSVQPPAGERKPYSLSRAQAAWWFFLVLASYLFIGLITGDYNTSITGTVLGLLGISSATVIGSAAIDAGKSTAAAAATGTPAVGSASKYWWIDMLSDAGGVSFHRFQMAAWTLVLGIIFVVQVYQFLAMPTFDGTLLALLGISAGTYLGLKIPQG